MRLTFILLASLGGLLFLALGLIVVSFIAISADTESEIEADTVPKRLHPTLAHLPCLMEQALPPDAMQPTILVLRTAETCDKEQARTERRRDKTPS
jgi:hypothetical protein